MTGIDFDGLGYEPITFTAYQVPDYTEELQQVLNCAHEWGETQGADVMHGDVAIGRAQVSRCTKCGTYLVLRGDL